MKLCPACDRHLFGPEPTCPFCGASQATTAAPATGGALASLALALTLGVAACGPGVEPEQTEGSGTSSSGDPTTTPPGTTMTTVGTTPMMTSDDGSATTSIDSTTAEADTTDDGAGSFYALRPDGGGLPNECDTFAQDCPPGEKCMPFANDGGNTWNALRCVPIDDDPDAPGEPCTVEGSAVSGIDSCALGAMCFDVDPETNAGTCVAMCTGSVADPQCAAADQACAITNDGVLTLCFDACDPLNPACGPDEGCYPVNDDFFCLQTVAMPGAQGQPCGDLNSCDPGLACLESTAVLDCAAGACCTEFCDTAAGVPCPGADQGVTCQPWYERGAAPPGFETVGVCVLP